MTEPGRMVPIEEALRRKAMEVLAAGAQAEEAPFGSQDEADALAREDELYDELDRLRALRASGTTEVPER